ncbi:MAG: FG-GAP repeat domain-containing protein [Verrucomicrobiales bacterium]
MRTRRILRAALLASVGLLAACGEREVERVAQPEPSDVREATVPGTAVSQLPDDPLEGGWETESWSAEIQLQLNRIKLGLVDGDLESPLAEVVVDRGHSTRLIPRGDAELDVRVSRFPTGVEAEPSDSFATALAELAELFVDSSPEHASAKVVGISAAGATSADTRVVVQLDGVDAVDRSERLQVNSQWECRWNAAGGTWKLESVRLIAGDQVRVPGGAFVDATEAVLGHDPKFREQFYHSQDHWTARIEMRMGIDVGGWQGVAVVDIDGDGLEDLYVSQPGGLPNRLYRHRPDGGLEDVSAEFGVDWLDATHGSLFADLDNDGDPDLLVGAADGIIIMENQGGEKFEVVATKLLLDGLAYSIASADIDQDGDLDFFVCGYNRRSGVSRHHLFVHPVPYHDANNGGRNALFRNDGNWRFTDVTRATGIEENNSRFSYAASWEDYDLDGDLDLYVANDFGRNCLYRNDLSQSGRVQFEDVAEAAGVVDIAPGMSVCWGDYNNDARADLYVGNMFSSAGNRIAAQPTFHAGADTATRGEFLRHAAGNSLFKNLGGGTFEDVGAQMGVSLARWAWSSKFADLDNDGWQDIVVANGFITQEDSGDL